MLEAGLGEAGVGRGDESAFLQLGAEVARVRVRDDLAKVVALAQGASDKLVEVELLGPVGSEGNRARRALAGRNAR